MRDTERLRARFRSALGGAALGSLGVLGCGDAGPGPDPAAQRRGEDTPAERESASAETGGRFDDELEPTDAEEAPEGLTEPPLPPPETPFIPREGEFDYYGVARDPFEDHDEEEGCPQGDWCGPAEVAALYAVPNLEPLLECPRRIMAQKELPIERTDQRLKGLSQDKRMQGRLVTTVTEEERSKGASDDTCCYHWFEYCSGRPLRDRGEAVVAELREGASWTEATELAPAPALSLELRERLARGWLEDAQAEHASVAAFARVTLELMALGAPPELLADVQQAALDEVRHAERCFALAARYGIAREPGPLPVLAPRAPEHAQLAVDTFIEGCVGETIASLVATRVARGQADRDPVIAETWSGIAEDEGRHAALAWQILAWSLEEGGVEAAEAVRARADQLYAAVLSGDVSETASWPELRALGRPDPRLLAATGRDAWDEIIMPTLAQVLDGVTRQS